MERQLPEKPSVRSRLLAWLLWRLPLKAEFQKTDGLRGRVLKSRPRNPRPPRSFHRRFKVDESTLNRQRVFTLSPRNRAARLHVLYLHGGAYVYQIMRAQWRMLAKLVERMDLAITIPLYPLAPEHTCTEVLLFAHAAYESVVTKAGGLPVVVLGDSAGGGMALALSQQLRDGGKPPPAAVVLISPWLDVTCADPSQTAMEKLDPMLAIPGLVEQGAWYAGELAPTDPAVSPIYGDMRGLPPMLVFTGTHDLLNTDVHRLQAKTADLPSWLTVYEYEDMLHDWPLMPVPEATRALQQVTKYLERLVNH